jgi:ribosomal protein S19
MQERNDDGEKHVTVRIQDRVGEYIQEFTVVKKSGKYLIKSIEYDI